MEQTKVILVTGASSGIGRFCAEHLAGLGYRVFGTSRRLTPAYAERCQKAMAVIEADEESTPLPTAVAQTVARIIQAKSPKLRYRVGSFEQRFFTAAKPIIPGGLYELVVMDHYGGK